MTHLGKVRHWRLTASLAVLVAMSMSMLAMAAGTASATTHKEQAPAAAAAPVAQEGYSEAVTGTTGDGRTVEGTFTPRKFHVVNKQLVVKGMLEGTISGGDKAPRTFHRAVTMPVEDVVAGSTASGGARMAPGPAISCDVLNLVLGPLDLNLLGLEVHLNEVVLDIIAVPGALLGDLLCAVAGLLSGGLLGNLLRQLQGLLNQILEQLNLP